MNIILGIALIFLGSNEGQAESKMDKKNTFGVYFSKSNLNEKKVLIIANKEAAVQGYDLKKFKEPEIKFSLENSGVWYVFFVGKIQSPGNHFFIKVADQTGVATFFKGE